MRKANNIEHILCDVLDLLESLKLEDELLVGTFYDRDEDLNVVTKDINTGEPHLWIIGVDEGEIDEN